MSLWPGFQRGLKTAGAADGAGHLSKPSDSKSPGHLLHCDFKSLENNPVTQFMPCLSHAVCKRSSPICYTPNTSF